MEGCILPHAEHENLGHWHPIVSTCFSHRNHIKRVAPTGHFQPIGKWVPQGWAMGDCTICSLYTEPTMGIVFSLSLFGVSPSLQFSFPVWCFLFLAWCFSFAKSKIPPGIWGAEQPCPSWLNLEFPSSFHGFPGWSSWIYSYYSWLLANKIWSRWMAPKPLLMLDDSRCYFSVCLLQIMMNCVCLFLFIFV